jgi:hypothetical protein
MEKQYALTNRGATLALRYKLRTRVPVDLVCIAGWRKHGGRTRLRLRFRLRHRATAASMEQLAA